MPLEVRIVHAALRKNIRNRMTHGFADAQLTLRAASGGILFVVAGHLIYLVMPGLDPGIHLFMQESAFGGWIAGSSPAMTKETSAV
jgi:hypothetical protein